MVGKLSFYEPQRAFVTPIAQNRRIWYTRTTVVLVARSNLILARATHQRCRIWDAGLASDNVLRLEVGL